MSAVTKIFVVLLVVLAVFSSAAEIVFINKQENSRQVAEAAAAARDTAQRQTAISDAQLKSEQSQRASERAIAAAQVSALMDANVKKDQVNAQLREDLALAKSAQSQAMVTSAASSSALQTAQTESSKLQEMLADSRKSIDELRAKLTTASSDSDVAGNTIDGLTQENKRLQLEVSDLNKQLATMASARQHPINPDGSTSADFIPSTLPKVVGVIRNLTAQSGQKYAEISVGGRDGIQKGMQLTVVQDGTFVGYLTVDNVDNTQAFGLLKGPKLNLIQPGKTQVFTRMD